MTHGTDEQKQSVEQEKDGSTFGSSELITKYAVELLEDRVGKAKKRLQDVSDELKKRKGLSYRFLQEIDDEIWYFKFHLGQFNKFFGVGYNAGVDARRNQLERLLFAAAERKRREELKVWDDLSRLRRDLQEGMKEYESLLRTQRALDKKQT